MEFGPNGVFQSLGRESNISSLCRHSAENFLSQVRTDGRLRKAAACSFGTLIQLEDDTPIAAIQRLIDEANPPHAENDK